MNYFLIFISALALFGQGKSYKFYFYQYFIVINVFLFSVCFAESEEKPSDNGPTASIAFIDETNATESGRQSRILGKALLFLDLFLLNALRQNNLAAPLTNAGFNLQPLPVNVVNSFVNLLGGGGLGGLGGGGVAVPIGGGIPIGVGTGGFGGGVGIPVGGGLGGGIGGGHLIG